MNDVTGYLDLSFDWAIDFPIYLMNFVDQNAQIESKLLVIIKHNAIYLFSAISIFSSPVQSTGRAIVVTLASALALPLPFPSRHF